MTVTEFALLPLRRDGHGDADLLEALLQCIEVQDQWIDENQPHLRDSDESLSSMYLQQDGSEPCLLITAPWDSAAGHQEWIQSKENQEALSGLVMPYLSEDAPFQLFHLEPAGVNKRLLLGDVVPKTSFSVSRLSVECDQKSAVEEKYQQLEEDLQHDSTRRQVWAGWTVEDGKDGRESLVLFWDPAVRSEKVDDFLRSFEEKDTRCFRSICSEKVCKL